MLKIRDSMKSFRIGGIHPPDNKLSAKESIKLFPLVDKVVIPMSQHIGAPATPCVQKGDKVKVGQLIGTATGFVSANVHSSVSGTVSNVAMVEDSSGFLKMSVIIDVEGDEWMEQIDRTDTIVKECNLDSKAIINRVAEAGIVGLGGAAFPTQVKLSIPEGKSAEYLLINGVECEPFLTSDYRLMMERGEQIIIGSEIIAKALGVKRTYIGIENNKKDAVAHLQNLAKGYAGIEVVPLKVRYPQGSEKQLIDAIVRRQIPSGKLPIDVGCVVQNVGTAFAVYEAVQKNKPLFERVVTVSGKGCVVPANYMVRVGTPIISLLKACGGLECAGKIIGGGPMMGRAVSFVEAPVIKGSSGVLVVLHKDSMRRAAEVCISCGKCVNVCCMGLEPYLLGKLVKLGRIADTEQHKVTDCIECGSCSYVCPAKLPLLDNIRLGKAEVIKIIRGRNSK